MLKGKKFDAFTLPKGVITSLTSITSELKKVSV